MKRFWMMAVVAVVAATGARALPLQSNHGALRAVPVAKPVAVDGSLDEWDTSGEMFVYNARSLRDRYSIRVHAMWDKDALYLGLEWKDPTPLINNVDPDRAAGEGWMSDSFQARFITDYSQIHFTAWYGSKYDKQITHIAYDNPLDPNAKVFRAPGKVLHDGSGYQQAFRVDSDARGYVQEIRIPWVLLYKNPQPMAGLKFRFSGEYFWGGPSGTKWPAVMWADPINLAQPQRIVLYQSPQNWGELELLAAGNLPRVEVEDANGSLQGPVAIRLEVPRDAVKMSVVIDDAQGARVRNLASHSDVSPYVVKTEGGKRYVEIPWDGRAEGKWIKDRSLFLGDVVAPGTYTVRGITQRGIGVVHAGSFYNPGTPPWHTADGTGGWLSDHSAPCAVGAVPASSASKGRVFLGDHGGECGVGFIGLGEEGRKIWEWVRLGSGAWHIAANAEHVYFITGGVGGPGARKLGRLNPNNGEPVSFTSAPEVNLPDAATGLAVHGKTVAVALFGAKKVLLLDGDSGVVTKEIPAGGPKGVAFRPNGELIILNEGEPQFGVAQPLAVATDSAGHVYVSDGAELNVKVFNAAGQLVRAIGEPGGHQPGPWNPRRMINPVALAVEERAEGRFLWVTEAAYSLKRVSVWNTGDGALAKDYLGGTSYSGSGGAMSDDLPDLGITYGLFHHVDFANYTYTVREMIGGRPEPQPGKQAVFTLGQFGPVSFGNGSHFLSAASGQPREYYIEGEGLPRVFMKRGDRWVCVAALGHASALPKEYPSRPRNPEAVFSWSDLDSDGYQTDDEFQWFDPGQPRVLIGPWGYRCYKDLTWYHSGFAFKPVGFTKDGAPLYDALKAERLPGDAGADKGAMYKTKFGYLGGIPSLSHLDENNVIHGLNWFAGYDRDGRLRWKYPNYWCAVHGAMTAPMALPGVVMGSLKITGVWPLNDQHDAFSIRGNIGQEFVIRDDGVYLAELFTDQRMAPSKLPAEEKIAGVPINDTTLDGEPFSGWMSRQRDGRVRMTYGHTDVRVAEVTGLDTITEISPVTVPLTDALVAQCREFQPKKGADAQTTAYTVARGGAFDANVTFGDGAIIVRQGKEEVGRAQLRYDDQNLYVAWQVFDTTPLVNKGNLPPEAFKSGDSVNLYFGATRVLLTTLSGKPVAVAYRADGPGDKPYTFTSPVRSTPFKYVSEESAIQWQAFPGQNEYKVVATIPWSVLAHTPASGQQIKADIGLLFGDDTGSRIAQRIHWVDKETNVVNDVPTEAEFSPTRWGTVTLQ